MKRSKDLTLITLGALSMALVAACAPDGPTVTADCVTKLADGTYQTVDEDKCDDDDGHSSSFIWLYGGSTYVGPNGRTYVRNGNVKAPVNSNVTTRSGVTRGGFGSSSKGGGGS